MGANMCRLGNVSASRNNATLRKMESAPLRTVIVEGG